jgi:glycosyltransferase involved in cell wall biosynthesis
MRVLHAIQSLHPRCGGPPAVVLRLAAAQARLGAKVGLLSYRDPFDDGAVERGMRLVHDLQLVERVELPRESGRLGRVLARDAGAWIESHARDWDVLQLHNIWDPVVRAGAAAADRARLPFVITPHGSLDPWAMRQTPLKRLKKRMALAVQMRGLLDRAMFLHVLNVDERDGLAELRLRAPAEIVANGISLEELGELPSKGTFRNQVRRIGDRPYILFLSRLHYKKGLDILIEAFAPLAKQIPELLLMVVGPDEGAKEPMLRRANELGVASQVDVVGPLYGREKYAALVDAAAFCLPSRMEGFSIAILEALACSCPVVISENCHFPEVMRHGAGDVVPLAVDRFTESLRRVLQVPDLGPSMGRKGRSMVESLYTWPTIASELLARYERCLRPEASR